MCRRCWPCTECRAQPAGHARRQPDVCGPPLREAAARTAPRAARRMDIPCKIVGSHSPRHPFQRSPATPASGYRNNTTGALGGIGDEGTAWSSSTFADGSNNAGRLLFKGSLVNPLNNINRSYGFSVRCVQASAGLPCLRNALRRAKQSFSHTFPVCCRPIFRFSGRFSRYSVGGTLRFDRRSRQA